MKYDKNFLNQIFSQQHQQTYIKIILLTREEFPIKEITGLATSGSISVNGTSSINRTCSLSMSVDLDTYNLFDTYFFLNHKFSLEVGIKNTITKKYDDIIWFKQGIFLINSYSKSINSSGFVFNISGVDKMALLNGTIGGIFETTVQLNKVNDISQNSGSMIKSSDDEVNIIDLSLKEILIKMLIIWGQEKRENIIIDIPDYGLEAIQDLDGNFIGYKVIDLVYAKKASELIANKKSTVQSILEQICSFLGNYEYFYNVNGQFVFQPTLLQKNFNEKLSLTNDFEFLNNELLTSISISSNINKIKNDFVISGTDIEERRILGRFAIQIKQILYL